MCHAISGFIDKGTETRWQGSFFALFLLNFIYFWLLCVFVAVRGLSLVEASRGDSRRGAWALEGAGFSSSGVWAQSSQLMGHVSLAAPQHVESSQTRD